MSFAELSATSNFTFLTGAAHPEEYMERAAELGLSAVAIADVNSVAGIVRAHARAREIARQVAERQAMEARDGPIGPPAPWPTDPQWTCHPTPDPRRTAGAARGAGGDRPARGSPGLGQPLPSADPRAAARGQGGLRSGACGSAGGGANCISCCIRGAGVTGRRRRSGWRTGTATTCIWCCARITTGAIRRASTG